MKESDISKRFVRLFKFISADGVETTETRALSSSSSVRQRLVLLQRDERCAPLHCAGHRHHDGI
jgi:hypothetical protein